MLVVVATEAQRTAEAARQLHFRGAKNVTQQALGRGRVLAYGGPFDDGRAVQVAADLRATGWTADVRPEAGGHLAAWQAHTAPVVIGRLWVCLPWSEFDREAAESVVEIDPGKAFGTGAHPSTRLLLEELEARIRGGERILDVGCGTGVLAIAAAVLGAEATAIDIDPNAVRATKANATRNHVGKRVAASTTPASALEAHYDGVVANIHAEGLIQLATGIQRVMKKGAWLAMSGLSPAQVSKVVAAYGDLQVLTTPAEGDWSAVVARRE